MQPNHKQSIAVVVVACARGQVQWDSLLDDAVLVFESIHHSY